jgi:hypothetical protein
MGPLAFHIDGSCARAAKQPIERRLQRHGCPGFLRMPSVLDEDAAPGRARDQSGAGDLQAQETAAPCAQNGEPDFANHLRLNKTYCAQVRFHSFVALHLRARGRALHSCAWGTRRCLGIETMGRWGCMCLRLAFPFMGAMYMQSIFTYYTIQYLFKSRMYIYTHVPASSHVFNILYSLKLAHVVFLVGGGFCAKRAWKYMINNSITITETDKT